MADKQAETVKEAFVDFKLDMRRIWRLHTDGGREFMGALDRWLRDRLIVHTDTGGYEPDANGSAENLIQELTQRHVWPASAG